MNSPVLDWEQLDMIADGFTPDFMEIYQEYVAEIPVLLNDLRQKINAGDALQVSKVAHQLKGSAANFGYIGVSRPMAELEQEAKAGSLAQAASYYTAAELGFSQALAEVNTRRGV
ncbi:hypothetical protein BH09VER1_BH09VER1_09980 [soil metagenome]